MDNVFLKSKASGVYKILWTLLKEEKVLKGQMQMCGWCASGFEPKQDAKGRGRPAVYCSARCRVAARRSRLRAEAKAQSNG